MTTSSKDRLVAALEAIADRLDRSDGLLGLINARLEILEELERAHAKQLNEITAITVTTAERLRELHVKMIHDVDRLGGRIVSLEKRKANGGP